MTSSPMQLVLLSLLNVVITSTTRQGVYGTVLRGVPDEQRLLAKIYRNYDNVVRPVYNATHTVTVKFGMTLIQIVDLEWIDSRLSWDPGEFNQLSVLRLPANKLWLPDIVLYNNADDYTTGYMSSNAMIHADGRVFWSPPARLRSSCKIDVTLFPFDEQVCWLKFGSWTYDQSQVDVVESRIYVDQSTYVTNGEWSLTSTHIERNTVVYPIGLAVYPDVTVTIRISRRTLYYTLNILLPCVWLNLLSLFAFKLPPDAGEKVTLGITVFLSYSVFMLMVADNMPPTSESVPLIGIYLTVSMAVTSLSILTTVFVLNVFHSSSTSTQQTELSSSLRHFVLHHLARLVRCRVVTKSCRSSSPSSTTRTTSPPKSTSFSRIPEIVSNRKMLSDPYSGRLPRQTTSAFRQPPSTTCTGTDASSAMVLDRHFDLPADYMPLTSDHDVIHAACEIVGGSARQLDVKLLESVEEIVRHLRSLVNKQDSSERREDIVNEWKEVALVIDQLLFWIFLVVTVLYTTVLLLIIPLSRDR